MNWVKGPLGAMLHHCHQIGWTMITPTKVRTVEGLILDLTRESPRMVGDHARMEARDAVWDRTRATRRDGDGA